MRGESEMIVGDIIYELTNKGAIHHGVLTLVFRGPLCTIRGRDGEFPARCSEGGRYNACTTNPDAAGKY